MFLFLENDAGGRLIFLNKNDKTMYPSNIQKSLDFQYVQQPVGYKSTNQPKTNKIAANDDQLKLTICDV